ncbi:MAG: alpha-ketoglutarate-dependent dioxygenase AlkB [Pseudomonadota bacterium]
MDDLFRDSRPSIVELLPGTFQLAAFADTRLLRADLRTIIAASPWRHQNTPGGKRIQVAITNCGELGWVSDATGYRYQATDPLNGSAWPAMPDTWATLAKRAAGAVGYADFNANACLINRYLPGDRMSSHQDRNEGDFSQPVVTLSMGLAAEFLLYGRSRGGKPLSTRVFDGDVIVMGGTSRMAFHGVRGVEPGADRARVSLTFRYAR